MMIRSMLIATVAVAGFAGVAQAQVAAPDYVKMAGASDKFEMTEAKMAESRSKNPKIRQFAAMMVKDHTDSTMKVKTAARKVMGHNPAPPMLDAEQQQNVDTLKSMSGKDFDRTYVDQQVASHQKALDLHQGYAQSGDQAPLRDAATQIVPVVQQHLSMATSMQSMMK